VNDAEAGANTRSEYRRIRADTAKEPAVSSAFGSAEAIR